MALAGGGAGCRGGGARYEGMVLCVLQKLAVKGRVLEGYSARASKALAAWRSSAKVGASGWALVFTVNWAFS